MKVGGDGSITVDQVLTASTTEGLSSIDPTSKVMGKPVIMNFLLEMKNGVLLQSNIAKMMPCLLFAKILELKQKKSTILN